MKRRTLLILLLFCCLFEPSLRGQDSLKVFGKGINLNFSYTSELAGNLMGGIKTGVGYLGQINLGTRVNTHAVGLWKGGEFHLQIQNSHGENPSTSLVGDCQIFSNIENGNFTYLYELEYSQVFGRLWLNVGIIDLNSEFIVCEEGQQLINSSFGVIPTISGNIPLSIFPKNSLGVMGAYHFTDKLLLQAALIDGNPGILEDDPYNIRHHLSKAEGYYCASEIIVYSGKSNFKLGGYYHSGNFVDVIDSTMSLHNNSGLYFITNQHLFQSPSGKRLTAFLQMGYAPTTRNSFDYYLGTGCNLYSPFNRKNDEVGIAIAYLGVCRDYYQLYKQSTDRFETAIEMDYHLSINDRIALQPNLQYIINPGMNKNLENSLVITLRFNLSL